MTSPSQTPEYKREWVKLNSLVRRRAGFSSYCAKYSHWMCGGRSVRRGSASLALRKGARFSYRKERCMCGCHG